MLCNSLVTEIVLSNLKKKEEKTSIIFKARQFLEMEMGLLPVTVC